MEIVGAAAALVWRLSNSRKVQIFFLLLLAAGTMLISEILRNNAYLASIPSKVDWPVVAGVRPLPDYDDSGREIVEILGRNLGGPEDNVSVYFGSSRQAEILSRTPISIICVLPPSPYPGIGYDVAVRARVRVVGKEDSLQVKKRGKPLQWGRESEFNPRDDDGMWVYRATKPATEVSNVMVSWLYERNSDYVISVIKLFSDRLGSNWRIQLFMHKRVAWRYLNDPWIIAQIGDGRLEFVMDTFDYKSYARKQVDADYWKSLHGDRVLTFQSDSVPCSGSKHDISEFFGYTYVGAPWCTSSINGGNSGLSLRNRTAFISMLEQHKDIINTKLSDPNWVAEDVLICLFHILQCMSLFCLLFHRFFLLYVQLDLEPCITTILLQRVLAVILALKPNTGKHHGVFTSRGSGSTGLIGHPF